MAGMEVNKKPRFLRKFKGKQRCSQVVNTLRQLKEKEKEEEEGGRRKRRKEGDIFHADELKKKKGKLSGDTLWL